MRHRCFLLSLNLHHFAAHIKRFGPQIHKPIRISKIPQDAIIIGIDQHGLFEIVSCLVHLSKSSVDHTRFIEIETLVWPQLYRLLVVFYGYVDLIFCHLYVTEIKVRIRILIIQLDRLLIRSDAAISVSQFVESITQIELPLCLLGSHLHRSSAMDHRIVVLVVFVEAVA